MRKKYRSLKEVLPGLRKGWGFDPTFLAEAIEYSYAPSQVTRWYNTLKPLLREWKAECLEDEEFSTGLKA